MCAVLLLWTVVRSFQVVKALADTAVARAKYLWQSLQLLPPIIVRLCSAPCTCYAFLVFGDEFSEQTHRPAARMWPYIMRII